MKSGNETILVFKRSFAEQEELNWILNEKVLFCEHKGFPQEYCIKSLIFERLENNLELLFFFFGHFHQNSSEYGQS